MARIPLLLAVSSPESVLFTVFGGALALLGGAMVSNVSGIGEWLVEHVIPRSLRMGGTDADRRKFGWGYLVVGLAVAVIGLASLTG